jgi:hypothetical protein
MFSGAQGKCPHRINCAPMPILPNFLSGNKNLKFWARFVKSKPDSPVKLARYTEKNEISSSSQCHNDFFQRPWQDQQMQQCHSWSFPSGFA